MTAIAQNLSMAERAFQDTELLEQVHCRLLSQADKNQNHTALVTDTKNSFHINNPPISLHDYIFRIAQYTNISRGTLALATQYICKEEPEINRNTLHRLFFTAVFIAIKLDEDAPITPLRYQKIGGMTLEEIEHLEREFCIHKKWRLFVSSESRTEFYNEMTNKISHKKCYCPDPASQQSIPTVSLQGIITTIPSTEKKLLELQNKFLQYLTFIQQITCTLLQQRSPSDLINSLSLSQPSSSAIRLQRYIHQVATSIKSDKTLLLATQYICQANSKSCGTFTINNDNISQLFYLAIDIVLHFHPKRQSSNTPYATTKELDSEKFTEEERNFFFSCSLIQETDYQKFKDEATNPQSHKNCYCKSLEKETEEIFKRTQAKVKINRTYL